MDRWVDTEKYILVPKPGFFRKRSVHAGFKVVFLLACTFGETACAGNGSVLDMRGGPFLALYFGLLIIACFFAFGAKYILTWKREAPNDSLEDPYEIACLGEGIIRVYCAALSSLLGRGLIRMGENGEVERIGEGGEDLQGPEAVIHGALEPGQPAGGHTLRIAVLPALSGIRDQLVSSGLLMSKTQWFASTALLALPLVPLGILGAFKIQRGWELGKPTDFLTTLVLITFVPVWGAFKLAGNRTRRGEIVWQRLKQKLDPELRGRVRTARDAAYYSETDDEAKVEETRLAMISPLTVAVLNTSAFSVLGGDYRHFENANPSGSSGGGGDGGGCGGCGGG